MDKDAVCKLKLGSIRKMAVDCLVESIGGDDDIGSNAYSLLIRKIDHLINLSTLLFDSDKDDNKIVEV